VLGIPGSDAYGTVLSKMANSGNAPNTTGTTPYYRVDVTGGVEALTTTIRQITTKLVTSCEVQLQGAAPAPDQINVALNCNLLPGPTSPATTQWSYTQGPPAMVTILGAACDIVQTQGADRVDVLMGCPTVQ
jgi:hypothetical protein